jgi:hypothetical protein
LLGLLFYLSLFLSQLWQFFAEVDFSLKLLPWILFFLVGWTAILIGFYRVLKPIANKKGFWAAIQLYAWILSAMTVIAFILLIIIPQFRWIFLLLPFGASFFMISDSLLAYNRFVKPIARGQLWVRITYHLAQFSLAYGFVGLIKNS